MVISKEKADKAKEIKNKFMNDNIKNTSMRCNWSKMENIPIDPHITENFLVNEARKELDKITLKNSKKNKMKITKDYDSTVDTNKHIARVNELATLFSEKLLSQCKHHDESKLKEPEKPLFDIYSPKLKNCIYGSDEYKSYLKELKPALDHHYTKNSHHPEHYEDGINDMNLIDLLEMFIDWKASSERHENGDIVKSIEINKKRFNMSEQLANIFLNTVYDFLQR